MQEWVWLGAIVIVFLFYALKEKRWNYFLISSVASFLVLIAHIVHWRAILSKYPFVLTVKEPAKGLGLPIVWIGFGEITNRIIWVSNFLLTPHTMHKFFGIVYLGLGILFYLAVVLFFRKEIRELKYVFMMCLLFLILFLSYMAFSPHASQYWGLHIIPLSLLGSIGLGGILLRLSDLLLVATNYDTKSEEAKKKRSAEL